ncbi:MAG: helix-turn-helix domain-containing protein [Deinococcota bacterium]|jgi:putative transposase|nr:helix-turn-helix domain-containing protein [Deinococcota bacterium]
MSRQQNGGFLYDAVVRYRVLKPHLEEGVPLPQLAREHGISLRTARRWLSRYREGGMAGLARKSRVTKGARVSVPEPLLAAVEALALRTPRWSVAAIHRHITALAAKEELSTPSYSTVYNVVSRLDPALVMLAHQGAKAYAETFELLYRREAQAPNALWQADHSQLPILLLDESGRASKPWLTVILDDYSRAVCGYFLSFHHPSAERTALALHQAIWRKREAAWRVWSNLRIGKIPAAKDRLESVAAALQKRGGRKKPSFPPASRS